jgi:DNA repair exonuclease SbcCD ATPase subunit
MADPTKDQLQEQLTQTKRQLEDTQHELDTTKRESQAKADALVAAGAEKAELQAQLTEERTRSGNLAGELNVAETTIEELQQRLETAAKVQAQSDTVVVTDGTAHYKVLAPRFSHKRVEYSAKDLLTNEELLTELVAAGVGFLQKIEE